MLSHSGAALAALATRHLHAEAPTPRGVLSGEPTAAKVAARVFADGGNAIDAIVAGALAAAVAAPHQTGIGGYGATAVFAVDGGKRVVALDANTAAPAAMRADIFQPNDRGEVPGHINENGWLAAGVPGILAGLQLALDNFGTRPFSEIVQPAIRIAKDGFPWPAAQETTIKANAAQFERDSGSRKLFFRDGQPLAAGALFQNVDLADMLMVLANANSVDAFYRGGIGKHIAEAFQKNGGLVTAEDFANYRAKLVEPLSLTWGDQTMYTAPLTAGGFTTLHALKLLQATDWHKLPPGLPRTQTRIEALRLAWRDRLTLLGDPSATSVPQAKLLSNDYATECAAQIAAAVKAGKYLAHAVTPRDHQGTINLSAADDRGNFAALTLTHGNSFGARVTVDGLGLTLGHGMSRFDPHPDHPNAPGSGKRPLHNMCPAIVTRDGCAVLAAGARGGRKIVNAIFELLTQFVALDAPLAAAIAAPRMHTDGTTTLEFESTWPAEDTAALAKLGYTVKTAANATISAVAMDNGTLRAAMR